MLEDVPKAQPILRLFTRASAVDFAAAYRIRLEVFVEEQRVPADLELDEHDDTATHALALDPGDPARALGTARLLVLPSGQAKIGRVAVLRAARRLGVGAALMSALEAEAVARGCPEVLLEAQCSALPFYERIGYVAEGDVYLDVGLEHRKMRKALAPR